MVGALMADIALLRTSTPSLLSSHVARGGLSRRVSVSDSNLTYFDGFLGTRSEGKAPKRAGGVRLRSARASVGEDRRGDTKEPDQFPPPGELQYFGKLSVGCIAGALLVKYGSLCVPSITTPNINVALLMISTPCVVSVAVLAVASVLGSDGNTRKQ